MTWVIGDVHGCLDELIELLALLPDPDDERIVLIGDLVDRGPKSVETVAFVREKKLECIMGNHDEKHVRYFRHWSLSLAKEGYANPMRFSDEKLETFRGLLKGEHHPFLAGLPLRAPLGHGDWWAVHGGCEPSKPFWKQDAKTLPRCRWVDAAGDHIRDAFPPAGSGAVFWADKWEGPEKIVYGHHVHNLELPVFHKNAVGIDTGCCFGGRLTAYCVEDGSVEQVKARAEYRKLIVATSEDV